MIIYEVQPGDNAYALARQFGVSPQRLLADNGLEGPERLSPGQALIILQPETVYTVLPGDSLYSVAAAFGTTVSALQRNNPFLTAEPMLTPGRVITISFTQKPSRTLRVNGYAYPYIAPALLRRELPFLSTLTIFGYGFTAQGELIPPDDEPPLAAAKEFGVAPVLLLSSITENGNFDTSRASLLFQDPELQRKVLSSIADVMEQKGYQGLDIDFEYVSSEDAQAFLRFIENAVALMHEHGFFVNVDLAPKSSAAQAGLLYEAHDYAAIGALADTVLLMTYEWGYTHGPPMAVAPLPQVRRVVDYALSVIPAEKIMLGVPNYGYDWALPFLKGVTQAVSIGNQYAVSLAGRHGATIEFDEADQSPSFGYRSAGVEHIVWFEDVRSIEAKLDLTFNRGLRGIGYWNLMRPFAQNWALLSVTVIPEKL